MSAVIRLTPALQNYDWGTTADIPALLDLPADGKPVAEAWWGAHALAPSRTPEGDLAQYIASDPEAALGETVAASYGRLPYLLKVLAIGSPLSIQVHPTLAQAREGFAVEQKAGIPLDARERVYKDTSHKPEMLFALSPMTALSAFRPLADAAHDLRAVGATAAADTLESVGLAEYVKQCLKGQHAQVLAKIEAAPAGLSANIDVAREALITYPGDNGALIALAMNVVELEPGDTIFTDAAIVHCYIKGFGLELMANSDNVVRAGFTPKMVDPDLLMELSRLEPSAPEVPRAQGSGAAKRYTTSASEFELTVVTGGEAVTEAGPRIVLALADGCVVATEQSECALARGEAVFIAHSEGQARVSTPHQAVIAGVPGGTPSGA